MANIHGTEWTIDTADWVNEADAHRCHDLIVEKLSALPAEVVAKARADYLAAKADDDAFDTFINGYGAPGRAAFDAIEAACSAAWNEVVADYYRKPDLGHNAGAWPNA